eukprot:gene27503-4814_t
MGTSLLAMIVEVLGNPHVQNISNDEGYSDKAFGANALSLPLKRFDTQSIALSELNEGRTAKSGNRCKPTAQHPLRESGELRDLYHRMRMLDVVDTSAPTDNYVMCVQVAQKNALHALLKLLQACLLILLLASSSGRLVACKGASSTLGSQSSASLVSDLGGKAPHADVDQPDPVKLQTKPTVLDASTLEVQEGGDKPHESSAHVDAVQGVAVPDWNAAGDGEPEKCADGTCVGPCVTETTRPSDNEPSHAFAWEGHVQAGSTGEVKPEAGSDLGVETVGSDVADPEASLGGADVQHVGRRLLEVEEESTCSGTQEAGRGGVGGENSGLGSETSEERTAGRSKPPDARGHAGVQNRTTGEATSKGESAGSEQLVPYDERDPQLDGDGEEPRPGEGGKASAEGECPSPECSVPSSEDQDSTLALDREESSSEGTACAAAASCTTASSAAAGTCTAAASSAASGEKEGGGPERDRKSGETGGAVSEKGEAISGSRATASEGQGGSGEDGASPEQASTEQASPEKASPEKASAGTDMRADSTEIETTDRGGVTPEGKGPTDDSPHYHRTDPTTPPGDQRPAPEGKEPTHDPTHLHRTDPTTPPGDQRPTPEEKEPTRDISFGPIPVTDALLQSGFASPPMGPAPSPPPKSSQVEEWQVEEEEEADRRIDLASSFDGGSVLASNKEAKHAGRAIDSDVDSFMKNPCNAVKWTILELSQLGRVDEIELTMKEMYSLESDSWQLLGIFSASNKKGSQLFRMHQRARVRYLLLQFHTHYGSEEICAMNSISVWGVSAAQELEQALARQLDLDINGGEVQAAPTHMSSQMLGLRDEDSSSDPNDATPLVDVDETEPGVRQVWSEAAGGGSVAFDAQPKLPDGGGAQAAADGLGPMGKGGIGQGDVGQAGVGQDGVAQSEEQAHLSEKCKASKSDPRECVDTTIDCLNSTGALDVCSPPLVTGAPAQPSGDRTEDREHANFQLCADKPPPAADKDTTVTGVSTSTTGKLRAHGAVPCQLRADPCELQLPKPRLEIRMCLPPRLPNLNCSPVTKASRRAWQRQVCLSGADPQCDSFPVYEEDTWNSSLMVPGEGPCLQIDKAKNARMDQNPYQYGRQTDCSGLGKAPLGGKERFRSLDCFANSTCTCTCPVRAAVDRSTPAVDANIYIRVTHSNVTVLVDESSNVTVVRDSISGSETSASSVQISTDCDSRNCMVPEKGVAQQYGMQPLSGSEGNGMEPLRGGECNGMEPLKGSEGDGMEPLRGSEGSEGSEDYPPSADLLRLPYPLLPSCGDGGCTGRRDVSSRLQEATEDPRLPQLPTGGLQGVGVAYATTHVSTKPALPRISATAEVSTRPVLPQISEPAEVSTGPVLPRISPPLLMPLLDLSLLMATEGRSVIKPKAPGSLFDVFKNLVDVMNKNAAKAAEEVSSMQEVISDLQKKVAACSASQEPLHNDLKRIVFEAQREQAHWEEGEGTCEASHAYGKDCRDLRGEGTRVAARAGGKDCRDRPFDAREAMKHERVRGQPSRTLWKARQLIMLLSILNGIVGLALHFTPMRELMQTGVRGLLVALSHKKVPVFLPGLWQKH